jgi:hypothetical protein
MARAPGTARTKPKPKPKPKPKAKARPKARVMRGGSAECGSTPTYVQFDDLRAPMGAPTGHAEHASCDGAGSYGAGSGMPAFTGGTVANDTMFTLNGGGCRGGRAKAKAKAKAKPRPKPKPKAKSKAGK